MTVNSSYQHLKNNLVNIYDAKESGNIAELVIEKITGLKRTARILNKHQALTDEQLNTLQKYLQELMSHKPVQYVLYEAWFAGMKFFVDSPVLIPRPETEELVDWIVSDAVLNNKVIEIRNPESEIQNSFTILDIGTGSGCIAIAMKNKIKNAEVFALDISEDALKIAALNAEQNNAKINFLKTNILKKHANISTLLFDIIVSNPPYITKKESAELHANVIAYEPHIALFVPDENPLLFYDTIADFSLSHLTETGSLYFETHENFANEVVSLLAKKGFQSIEIKKDLQQKNRMVKAVLHK